MVLFTRFELTLKCVILAKAGSLDSESHPDTWNPCMLELLWRSLLIYRQNAPTPTDTPCRRVKRGRDHEFHCSATASCWQQWQTKRKRVRKTPGQESPVAKLAAEGGNWRECGLCNCWSTGTALGRGAELFLGIKNVVRIFSQPFLYPC